MENCGLIVDGNSLSDYINDVDTSNTVNKKTLYYYIDKNNINVPSDAGEVILINCTYCNITNLDLSNGTIGVELAFSSYNNVSGNIINDKGKTFRIFSGKKGLFKRIDLKIIGTYLLVVVLKIMFSG